VALDDATSAEWNTDADGEHKRELADDLAERLRATYAFGGIVHRGEGKWYPGEPLPRWNIALQWRTDGVPLWSDPALFADPWSDDEDPDAAAHAEALAQAVARLLGLPGEQVLPAHEDPLAALTNALREPAGPRPGADEPGAEDVAGLDAGVPPSGWVLPITTQEEWTSPAWTFRRGRLVLRPGTSAVGLRLPLDSISWKDPEHPGEPSYLEAGPPLQAGIPQVSIVDPEDAPTTALAFEARAGQVHVFLPPTTTFEAYAALLALIEAAATSVGCRIVLEGYGPPPDARLTQLIVTPDPGVIEVNVQPTSSWHDLRDLTFTLYEQARQSRLATEKFDLDGLHTGTGGGNHITLGGAQPVDSPLLRRPDLLASLVTYWQRHPSLSYLFSGRFIGPTSQAPRFDEGRPEAVYEMEIALQEVRRLSDSAADLGERSLPWVVDRALRHLLTDLTGNTHRAEFCIDKLYSPDSSRGRLGLLELRGFEMPPHPQLALVQALLVRSIVAMLWEKPISAPLIRWGTRLHEDFLLPQGTSADIDEVVADLRGHGIAFQKVWLDAFTEFRFPRIGMTRIAGGAEDGIELELRQAVEPWNVLGEEATAGGTARYVDSSVERIQVKVRGIDPRRHLVTCESVPVPLTPTGVPGEYYAGVRYRAWQPSSALHPTIPVHAPLVFDVVDTDSGVSIGGATYHVVHPGGRSYDHPPINSNEAEARRASRFEPHGHTAGHIDVAALREAGRRAFSPDYPHTLDLRRVPVE
ncbi:MAG: transglutaminase family protein, partial [Actinobacteria bacterium]|nr:transglutaminase family protein [Actinomycetota bacterium]